MSPSARQEPRRAVGLAQGDVCSLNNGAVEPSSPKTRRAQVVRELQGVRVMGELVLQPRDLTAALGRINPIVNAVLSFPSPGPSASSTNKSHLQEKAPKAAVPLSPRNTMSAPFK